MECGAEDKVKRLLKAGIVPDEYRGFNKQTSLHLAVHSGQRRMVQLLLQGGASPLSCDINGATPLHLAAEHGNLFIIKMLLDAGAARCIQMTYGVEQKTPEQLAMDKGHTEIAEYLQQFPKGRLQYIKTSH